MGRIMAINSKKLSPTEVEIGAEFLSVFFAIATKYLDFCALVW